MMATSRPTRWAMLAHQRGAVDVVLRLAVAEVQPHHVDAGADHALQHLGSLDAGPRVATILVLPHRKTLAPMAHTAV
jgi:hypothetical protein